MGGADEISISLKCANADTTRSPELRVPSSTSTAQLKARIIAVWPGGGTPPAASDLRMFCMGRELVDGNLDSLPRFDFPTPVHVTIKPGKGKASTASKSMGASPVKTPAQAHAAESGCCVVM